MSKKSDFEKLLEEIIAAEEKSIVDYDAGKENAISPSIILEVQKEIPKMKAALEAYRKAAGK